MTQSCRPLRAALLVCLLATACPDPDGGPTDGGPPDAAQCVATEAATFRVVTWNVHDLFDASDDAATLDDVPTSLQVDEKLDFLAVVLNRIGADLAVLEEVENRPLLQRLADRTDYQHVYLIEAHDSSGIDVGVLSLAPLDHYVSYLGERNPDGQYTWSRDCVEAYLTLACHTVVVQGNHFISPTSSGAEPRRTAQAEAARAHADEVAAADPTALVIVAGDLNDEPDSPALAPLLVDGVYNDVGAGLASSWTYQYSGDTARIDYILVHQQGAAWLDSAQVVAGSDVEHASDHRPVVADFVIPPG